jgi:FkbM family methyltransferase
MRPGRRLRAVAAALRFLGRHVWFVEDEAGPLADLVPAEGVCVDVGAEFGLYTMLFAEAAGPGGRVVSVEANPGLTHWLRRACTVLGADNVQVLGAAVGDRQDSGFLTLSVPYRRGRPVWGRAFVTDGTSGPGPNAEFSESRDVLVPAVTLDRVVTLLNLEEVDIVKADIEGAELAMLLGAEQVMTQSRPTWMLEVEDRHLEKYLATAAEVFGLLEYHGYLGYRLVEGVWRRHSGLIEDDVGNRNHLFVPRESLSDGEAV